MITRGHTKNTTWTAKQRLSLNFEKSVLDAIRRTSYERNKAMSTIVNEICKKALNVK